MTTTLAQASTDVSVDVKFRFMEFPKPLNLHSVAWLMEDLDFLIYAISNPAKDVELERRDRLYRGARRRERMHELIGQMESNVPRAEERLADLSSTAREIRDTRRLDWEEKLGYKLSLKELHYASPLEVLVTLYHPGWVVIPAYIFTLITLGHKLIDLRQHYFESEAKNSRARYSRAVSDLMRKELKDSSISPALLEVSDMHETVALLESIELEDRREADEPRSQRL